MTGTPERSTESGFMEKPGIEPATIGLSPTPRRLPTKPVYWWINQNCIFKIMVFHPHIPAYVTSSVLNFQIIFTIFTYPEHNYKPKGITQYYQLDQCYMYFWFLIKTFVVHSCEQNVEWRLRSDATYSLRLILICTLCLCTTNIRWTYMFKVQTQTLFVMSAWVQRLVVLKT